MPRSHDYYDSFALRTARSYIFNRKYLNQQGVITYRNASNMFIYRFLLFLTSFFILMNVTPRLDCKPQWTAEDCAKKQHQNRFDMFLICFYVSITISLQLRLFLGCVHDEVSETFFSDAHKFTRTVDDLLADNPAGVLIEFGNQLSFDTQVPIVSYYVTHISMRELIGLTSARGVFEMLHDPLLINPILQFFVEEMQNLNSYFSKLSAEMICKIIQCNCKNNYLAEFINANCWGFWHWLEHKLNRHMRDANIYDIRRQRNGDTGKPRINAYLEHRTSVPCLLTQFTAIQKQQNEAVKCNSLPLFSTLKKSAARALKAQPPAKRPEVEYCFDIESQQMYEKPVRDAVLKMV